MFIIYLHIIKRESLSIGTQCIYNMYIFITFYLQSVPMKVRTSRKM